jgi:hypothetical protein
MQAIDIERVVRIRIVGLDLPERTSWRRPEKLNTDELVAFTGFSFTHISAFVGSGSLFRACRLRKNPRIFAPWRWN